MITSMWTWDQLFYFRGDLTRASQVPEVVLQRDSLLYVFNDISILFTLLNCIPTMGRFMRLSDYAIIRSLYYKFDRECFWCPHAITKYATDAICTLNRLTWVHDKFAH